MQTELEQEHIANDEQAAHQAVEDAVGDGIEGLEYEQPILAKAGPIRKCAHGVYIAQGDVTAKHCGMCNPQAYDDPIIRRAMMRYRVPFKNYKEPAILDASEYMNRNMGERMELAREFIGSGE